MAKPIIKTLAALSLSGVTVATTNARAQVLGDEKTLPGTVCSAYDRDSVEYSAYGHITATKEAYVSCPIVRDSDTTRLYNISVRPISTKIIECTLHSASATGELSYDRTDPKENALGNMVRFDGDELSHYSKGTYWVNCSLDAGDAIASIRWEEQIVSGEDAKTIPGNFCTNHILNESGEPHWLHGAYDNAQSTTITAVCPLIRREEAGRISRVEMRVDPPSNSWISCVPYSQANFSTSFDLDQAYGTIGSSLQTLTFNLQLTQWLYGTVTMSCNLPPGGEIRSIRYFQ